MRIACWTTKTTDTHPDYETLIASPQQQWPRERPSVLRLHVNCLSCAVLSAHRSVSVFCFDLGTTSSSPLEPSFDPRPDHARFVVECHWIRYFSEYFGLSHTTSAAYSSASTCSPYQQDNIRGLEAFQNAVLLRKSGSIGWKNAFPFPVFRGAVRRFKVLKLGTRA